MVAHGRGLAPFTGTESLYASISRHFWRAFALLEIPLMAHDPDHCLLKDKGAIITGGAGRRGIGFATASMFARHVCSVSILD